MGIETAVIVILFVAMAFLISTVIFFVTTKSKLRDYRTLRVVLDSDDTKSFNDLMQVLSMAEIIGATYDDNGELITAEFQIPKRYFKGTADRLGRISNIEIAEVH